MAAIKREPGIAPRRSERQQLAKALETSRKEAETKGVSKRKRFHRRKQRVSCKFVRLPGELRNQIYRYALVLPKDKPLKISATGPGEPSLLRVCRSVRAETRSIYYSENSFELLVRNYNGAAFVPFARQFWPFSCRLGLTNVTFQLTGMPIWKNLVEWVKADRYYFFDLIPELSSRREDHLDHVLAGLFKLANALRGSSWHTVEQALAAMRLSLMGTCAAFWIDEGYDEESDW